MKERSKGIAHLTTVHARNDTRIFRKQCCSLARNGYRVTMVIADGRPDETIEGVAITSVSRQETRLARMTRATRALLTVARQLDATIYHIHDPELLPVALVLKLRGNRVIFDAHEDLPKQILSKEYLPRFLRTSVAWAVKKLERVICTRIDAVVAATPAIAEKFASMGAFAVVVNNYPSLGELSPPVTGAWRDRKAEVCYVGGITKIRGIEEVLAAMERVTTGVKLNLVGQIGGSGLETRLHASPGWSRVFEHGWLDRNGVADVMARSVAGIVTFLPVPNHIEAQPNKMFEYMSAGIPVIASNFPLWRDIVEGNDCGICVDPTDPSAIAAAIDRLVLDPETARRMGENGKRAVAEKYNWGVEEKKLLALYHSLSVKTSA